MIRAACSDDAYALFSVEKAASTVALAHVFADESFPDDDVLARWTLVLSEPAMTVLIDVEDSCAVGFVAYADGWLHHLGVLPRLWGTGRAAALHDRAVADLRTAGVEIAHLWVLVLNSRARAFYRRRGWVDAGIREEEVFPPHPTKMLMSRQMWEDCAFPSL